jgi:hypothetical protein
MLSRWWGAASTNGRLTDRPPVTARCSTINTDLPAIANVHAADMPLWPAPMTM